MTHTPRKSGSRISNIPVTMNCTTASKECRKIQAPRRYRRSGNKVAAGCAPRPLQWQTLTAKFSNARVKRSRWHDVSSRMKWVGFAHQTLQLIVSRVPVRCSPKQSAVTKSNSVSLISLGEQGSSWCCVQCALKLLNTCQTLKRCKITE